MSTSKMAHSRFDNSSDEAQAFLPQDHIVSDGNDVESPKKPRNDESKLGADTFAGVAMVIVGTIMYGIFGILSRLSMLGKRSTPYQSAAAMVVAECGKFVVSLVLLLFSEGIQQMIQSIKAVPKQQWLLFSIPAAIYSITNNLDFYILQYMDPASMQVLVQSKIVTTALLWWWWFKKSIDKQQWVAISILCVSSMLVAWPEDKDSSDGHDTSAAAAAHTMYVEWPIGPILVAIQVCLSAMAGVYTEWVYKRFGQTRSIHIDNLSMYFWGTLSNAVQFFYMNRDKDPSTHHLLYGFNYWTWLLIVVYVVQGLCISQIMKYFSNIVKLFMTGASIAVSGCLTWLIFGLNFTSFYVLGLCLVIVALLLYKSPTKWIK
mmetsp:Transcript_32633/g.52928  ORF Transcript_32633/g.52928 Transcript_32633/m.52928 type:complete len:374 (+) Transcript_32633:53-1174(+)